MKFPRNVDFPQKLPSQPHRLVIAEAKDIMHALQNSSPGSPLARLTDSETAISHSLSDILVNHNIRS